MKLVFFLFIILSSITCFSEIDLEPIELTPLNEYSYDNLGHAQSQMNETTKDRDYRNIQGNDSTDNLYFELEGITDLMAPFFFVFVALNILMVIVRVAR